MREERERIIQDIPRLPGHGALQGTDCLRAVSAERWACPKIMRVWGNFSPNLLFFFFITLKPRIERYTESMRLNYEPASEPMHISVK